MDNSFIAIDGDDVGNRLRDFIVANDIQGASAYSKSLDQFFARLAGELTNMGCKIVFCGGDSILAIANSKDVINLVLSIPSPLHPISVGVGKSAELSYLALQLAKARGKAQIVEFDNVVAATIKTW